MTTAWTPPPDSFALSEYLALEDEMLACNARGELTAVDSLRDRMDEIFHRQLSETDLAWLSQRPRRAP